MRDALEVARIARFTVDEWDAYIAVGMAIQDKRGALSVARKEGLRLAIAELCDAFGIELSSERRRALHALDPTGLREFAVRLRIERRWP